ncbi:four helix bundle protein [Zobellia galactanivorans]|uniref:four helix bundle protein n=1 Tax=Zobellia galactanivorans (strain DSM 12802 / CCUG 47099 / CIP 106680 / NCIMB 13871 / Dsij) TaxID=63186 RepID=UPI0026E32637|nr:four helix bundle protein [Zobellia galactanivorans]MDO6808225.1 four helix bundle protein [Zobellia galactanivorans]
MDDKKYDLEDRLVNFAADIAIFCREIPKDFTGEYYGNQLLRSAGSSALNFGEAQGTHTSKDYVHKASICLKELKESRVNLKILNKIEYGNEAKRNLLTDEAQQLIKIIAAIIRNKKHS